MRIFKLFLIALSLGLIVGSVGYKVIRGGITAHTKEAPAANALTLRYRLDAAQSNFMVRTFSGGLLFFKGHDHFIKVGDFSGEAQLTPTAINPASLQMTIRADSLAETRDVFTPQQKQIINKEIRELVLETAKYPEIVFKSTEVTGKLTAATHYEAKIGGDLTLHGATRHIMIPAEVTLEGNNLRAQGEFTINRGDYNVKATTAKNGTIRVRDKLKFTFDIVAHQL
ncbi:MAG TPA: YceI family protein [Pyrinomonadaceae bacterium]|jgi:polyisoprenoid-binding protein YceI